MTTCASCGRANPPEARFCLACGTSLAAPAGGHEVRKTVTVVFADITGSTGLGERLDPESTRQVMGRYFDAMRVVLERHGGTVEKFIGDAVMAVFGVPILHEDDALRAVRAAAEMQSRLADLNAQLRHERGVTLEMRIGINSGEVVAGRRGQTLVTGDAVNVAARLEQAAAPGEILIGVDTERLVRSAIVAQPVAPLDLKGKADEVSAFRLDEVLPEATGHARHLDAPLVGRIRELALLRQAFDRAVDERACFMFTLLGSAGVGKSRLVHEFLAAIRDGATVLRGRCLPYGEGITFWPIAEMVKSAAEIGEDDSPQAAQEKIRRRVDRDSGAQLIAERLGDAIGLSQESRPTEELFWGVRRFLEALAAERPVVVLIDDLQWAEPTLLELVEHVADWSRDAPIMLTCLARPELLEQRTTWGGGKLNATTVLLEPLNDSEAGELIANLLGGAGLPPELERRVTETAEGNPLFVEEFVAMLIDDGLLRSTDRGWQAIADLSSLAVPSTIHALVSARLDRLEDPARDVIGRASVVGKVFQRAAVAELSPPEARDGVAAQLLALVRRELVRPDRSTAFEDAYRFRHILVRDAAYAALPKEERASLHERFATWLERTVGERAAEYEEILGYHLEQAHRYLTELGPETDATRRLAERSARYLSEAGERALNRGDMAAAVKLLVRSAELLPIGDRRRGAWWLDAALAAQTTGRREAAEEIVARARDDARTTGDERLLRLAEVIGASIATWFAEGGFAAEPVAAAIERARPHVEAEDDHHGRALVWLATSELHLAACHWAKCLDAAERGMAETAAVHAPALHRMMRIRAGNAMVHGPTPADAALERMAELGLAHQAGGPWTPGAGGHGEAQLLAMLGEADAGREMLRTARQMAEEYGLGAMTGGLALTGGEMERIAGDPDAAERELRSGIDLLERAGETGLRSTLEGNLAWLLAEQGRDTEAEQWASRARTITQADDIAAMVEWRSALALVEVSRGRLAEAERLASEALELLSKTDFLDTHGRTRLAMASVREAAGDAVAARAEREKALELFEAKHNWASAERVRAMLHAGRAGTGAATAPSAERTRRPRRRAVRPGARRRRPTC